ncbi:MAG: hypothetical protein PHQ60_02030 [Sideroxydans sp.]|nr:hypothetical protein [Sideroxydans sp.]MDD5056621.1 hypothetical protein [Sideroxydans sp.]
MKNIFLSAKSRKAAIAIIAAFFGMLVVPRTDAAAASVYVLPALVAGFAFGVSFMQLFELGKLWKAAGMEQQDSSK